MRNSHVVTVFTAILSLAFGIALYFAFLHSTPDLSVPGQVQAKQFMTRFAAETPFSFSAYSEPRKLSELQFITADRRPLTLKAFRGKLVLLNVWATWCGPCREEMPTLDRLQARLGGAGFQVLALSIDREGPDVVKEFYAELGLTSLDIYVDAAMHAPAALNIIGVPATLLISPQGREIARVLGPAVWDSPEVVKEIRRYLEKYSSPG